jgi:hydrogenase expression/formation protein
MVIGTRLTGGIAAVGVCDKVLARKDIKLECDILMTEGAGGGTIATTALYNARPDKIIHTLNIKFLQGMELLLKEKDLLEGVYCCCDVTNGGLRGDLFEILNETDLGVEIFEKDIVELVNPEIKELLDSTATDYLGVSLDALLIFCKPDISPTILKLLNANEIKTKKIGSCTDQKGMVFHPLDGETRLLTPRFRESAYTPVKKVIGEKKDKETQDKMNTLVERAYEHAIKKKERILNWIKKSVN